LKFKKFSTVWFSESIIDDVSIDDEEDEGCPILFQNPDIRRMLSLAKVNKNDTFFDLGCGWGQNLKIALMEYNVKRAIGFEHDCERNKIASERLAKLEKIGITKDRYEVRNDDFNDLLRNKLDVKINEATVIFFGLSNSTDDLKKMEKSLRKGCRLICYYKWLFPEIMPDKDKINFPFYVYTFPFKKTKSVEKWLYAIIQKNKSSIQNNKRPTIDELWDEMAHDYSVQGDVSAVDDYKKRLRG